jgi:hypothetical protein
MEKLDHAKNGCIMAIEENLYIYLYKQHNKLVDEQRAHEDNHSNILYDTAFTALVPKPKPLARRPPVTSLTLSR